MLGGTRVQVRALLAQGAWPKGATAALLALSAANWAYTWLKPETDTDALAESFFTLLLDGMRGYSTP